MPRAWLSAGLVLLVAGIVVAGLGVLQNAVGTTQQVAAYQWLTFSPNTVGVTSTTILWTGADNNTTVDLISGSPHVAEFRFLCQAAPGLVARGHGPSGSIVTDLSGGATYSVYACTGNPADPISGIAVTFTYQYSGLSLLILAGVLIAIVGILLMIPRVRSLARRLSEPRP